jgi:hypothetical protein
MNINIKIIRNAVTILTALVLAPQVSALSLDFEGLQDQEDILEFYNGGTGSLGSSGVDYGISFVEGAQALIDSDAGGTGSFANEPTADTIAFWLTGSDLLMNVVGGFDTGFSFFYSSKTDATVTVYDAPDGGGSALGTIDLSAQYNIGCGGDPTGDFCNWTAGGVAFTGTALSVSFSGTANFTAYDNITFGSDVPEGRVPVPAAVWLFGSGLLALVAVARRKRS